MKVILPFVLCMLSFLIFPPNNANAQTYSYIPVTGFTADVIADGSATGSGSTNANLDNGSPGYVFVSTTFNPGGGVCASTLANGGFPTTPGAFPGGGGGGGRGTSGGSGGNGQIIIVYYT